MLLRVISMGPRFSGDSGGLGAVGDHGVADGVDDAGCAVRGTHDRHGSTDPAGHRIRPSVQQPLDAMTGAAAHIGNDRLDILGANPLGRALFLGCSIVRSARAPRASSSSTRAPATSTSTGNASRATSSPPCARLPGAQPLRPRADRPRRRAVHPQRGVPPTLVPTRRPLPHQRRQAVHHREVGDLELNYERLEVVFDTGLTIFTYTADPGTRSADALALLGTWAATTEAANRPARH